MTKDQNIFVAEESDKVKSDRDDLVVRSALELLEASRNDPNSIEKDEMIEEDVQLKRDFHAKLPNGRRPLMKSSIYAIVSRKIRINGIRAPRVDSVGVSFEDQLALDLVKEGLDEINFNKRHKEIYDRYETEGNGFVIVQEVNGELVSKVIPKQDFFCDPEGRTLDNEWLPYDDQNIRWFGYRESLKRKTFNDNYPEFADKVSNGSPLSEEKAQVVEHDGSEDSDFNIDGDIEVIHLFSLIGEPRQLAIAGTGATKLWDLSGDKYKYRADNGKPYLPLFIFDFSTEKIGLYSSSVVTFVKDGAEYLKKMMTAATQNALRISNAPVYMFGSSDEGDIADIEEYYRMAEKGYAPVIQRSDPNIRMQQLAPNDISPTFAAIKALVLDDLSERLGFMLRKHDDNPQVRVSIYVRQDLDEGEAIRAIDRRNNDTFLRMFKCIYWMKRDLVPQKKRKAPTSTDRRVEIKPSMVKSFLKGYTPEFLVDTDMDLRPTLQDRVQSIDVVSQDIMNLYASNIQDKEVAQVLAELKYRKAVLLGQGKGLKKEDMLAAAIVEPPVEISLEGMNGGDMINPIEQNPLNIEGEPKALQQMAN